MVDYAMNTGTQMSVEPTPVESTKPEAYDTLLPVEVGPSPQPVAGDVANDRAYKAIKGMPNSGETYAKIHSDMTGGDEESARLRMAAKMNMDKSTAGLRFIRSYSEKLGRPVTPEESRQLLKIYDLYSRPEDADTLIEKYYSKAVLDDIDKTIDGKDGPAAEEKRNDPNAYSMLKNKASDYNTTREIVVKHAQNNEEVLKQQGWVPWLADFFKTFVPGYTDVKLRERYDRFLDEELRRQADNILSLGDPVKINAALKAKMDVFNRDNPQLGQKFMEYMIGKTYSESFWDAAVTPLELTVLPGAKIGRGLAAAGKAALTPSETMSAIKNTLRGLPPDKISTHSVHEAAGNLSESAIQQMRQRAIAKIAGSTNEEKEAVENLFDMFLVTARGAVGPVEGKPGTAQQKTFTTAKGSVYHVLEDGTTIRNKALRDEIGHEGDQGIKPKSDNTFYVPDAQANRLAEVQTQGGKKTLEQLPDGRWGVKYLDGKDAGKFEQRTVVAVQNEPRAGLTPVEVWKDGSVHFGNKIIKVETSSMEIRPARPVYPSNLSKGLLNKLDEMSMTADSNVWQALANFMKVNRLPSLDQNIEAVMRGLHQHVVELYPGIGNRILNVSAPYRGNLLNVWKYDMFLGKQGNETFSSLNNARMAGWMARLPDNNYEIVPHGSGFAIKITKAFRETEDFVRDLLVATNEAKSPDSFLGSIVAWANVRTPEEVLSIDSRMQRKTAMYAPSNYSEVIKKMSEPIQELSRYRNRKAFKDWETIVKLGRDEKDPATGIPGYFYKSTGELNQAYLNHIHRLPSDLEVTAYYAYKNVMDFDYILRNLQLYKMKARQGAEQLQISLLTDVPGKKAATGWFEGIVRATLPRNDDTLVIMGKKPGDERVVGGGGGSLTNDERKLFDKQIAEGRLKVLEIYDVSSRPLQEFSPKFADIRPRYLLVENHEAKALTVNQIPYRGGGHFEYDYDFYIKQAKVRPERINEVFRHWYEGDTTIMPMQLRSMATGVAKQLESFRIAFKANDEAAMRAAASKTDIDYAHMKSWFEDKHVNGRNVGPMLSKDEPIQVVGKNETIGGKDKELEKRYKGTFADGTKSGDLSKMNQVEFTGERDAFEVFTVRDVGTRYNPLYKHEPAKMIDPLPSINRSISRIVKSGFLDDYKLFAMEHWLEENKGIIKQPESEIRFAPFDVFHNAVFKPDADKQAVAQAKNRQYQIQSFLGTKDEVGALLQTAASKLADMVYGKFGPKAIPFDPTWMLAKIKEPLDFLRAVTFHDKLGLFNVPQILIQAQGFANILAVAGIKQATGGAYSMMLTQWARTTSNPAVLAKLDDMMTKLRMPGSSWWKSGEFTESLQGLKNSGFMNVAGEHAQRASSLAPNLFQSSFGKFLDTGAWFFREGERSVRVGAWHVAYREFRDANPIAKITEKNWQQIQERADLLSNNMSRASNSSLHTGIMQFPAQFLAYQIRLAELFWGKRLGDTVLERNLARARMVGWYGVLYGAPVSIGVTGLPLVESIRKGALENNYVVGEQWYSSLINEGLPAYFAKLVTGVDLNVGEAYGPSGMKPLREFLTGDKSTMELFGGASYSVLKDTYEGLSGFHAAMMSGIRDDGVHFPLKFEDILGAARAWSAAQKADRWWLAYKTGSWASKKGIEIDQVKPWEAALFSLTGTQRVQASDAHLIAESLKDEKDKEKKATDFFNNEFRKSIRAAQNNDPVQAQAYMTRGLAFLRLAEFPDHKVADAISKAAKEQGTLIERLDWQFYVRNAKNKSLEENVKTLDIKRKLRETE